MYRLWTVIPYASNVSFYWPIDERSSVDQSIQEWRYFNNRRFTHCQLDTRLSIRALRFSNPAQLFWNIGVLRLEEPLFAHYLPIKSQNCKERRLQVEHFTPCIPDAKYRLRKHGCLQKVNYRYFGLKSRGIFASFVWIPPRLLQQQHLYFLH